MSSTVQFCDKVIERREGESILEALVRTGSDVPFKNFFSAVGEVVVPIAR